MSEQKKAEADDKSINDLLKEYADDVKDKDLDDFLKSDDDAFESEDSEGSDDDKAEETAAETGKKSSGLLTGLLMLVVFSVAGAGTYIYLNRDSGMTSIMGGFTGSDTQAMDTLEPVQPETSTITPDSAATLPAPAQSMETDALTGLPIQPMPIANEATIPATPAPVAASPTPTAPAPLPMGEEPPASELLATGAAAVPAPAATPLAEPTSSQPQSAASAAAVAKEAAKAVDAWASGEEPNVASPASDLPVQPVEEVKAQPVKSAPKQEAAPKKEKVVKQVSPEDEALPPPYVAIQGGKAKPSTAGTTGGKMQPVIEGGTKAARNVNEADVTSASGDYRTMVMQGGGKIEISGSKTTIMPAGSSPSNDNVVPAGVSARPEAAPKRLAISGARSLPDGYVAPEPARQAATPVAAPETDAPEIEAPAVEAPVVKAAPQAEGDAKAVLSQAIALEKAGKTSEALELYQRALELDAVYGNGQSIDRGMVYDRIGAIRAAR